VKNGWHRRRKFPFPAWVAFFTKTEKGRAKKLRQGHAGKLQLNAGGGAAGAKKEPSRYQEGSFCYLLFARFSFGTIASLSRNKLLFELLFWRLLPKKSVIFGCFLSWIRQV
jgi:hypothetical protein